MKSLTSLQCAIAALVLLTAVSTATAQQQRTSLRMLTESSEAVVVARAVQTESFWNDDQTAILTRVVLEVEDQLDGQASPRTEVIIPGGQIGNIIHEVSDMPHFEVDEEAIVFVERHRSGILIVSGGHHGKLPVTRDEKTGIRMVSGTVELIESDTDGSERQAEDDQLLPLDDFKLRLKELRDRR